MAMPPRAPGQRQATRQATRPAEWAAAIGGGLALAGILVWLLRGPFWADPPTPADTAGQQPDIPLSATSGAPAPPPSPGAAFAALLVPSSPPQAANAVSKAPSPTTPRSLIFAMTRSSFRPMGAVLVGP